MFAETNVQNISEGLSECLEVQKYINELNLNNNTTFSPKLARGLGIYTHTVFEFFDKQNRISSSLGGGGRYNKIITNFMDNGMEYPAVGLSFGLEPIYVILAESLKQRFIDVLIVPVGTEIECLKVANALRETNAKVVIDFTGKKVKKAFEYANKMGIKFVMVVGENEINSKLYSIKDMEKAEQVTLPLQEVINLVKENLDK